MADTRAIQWMFFLSGAGALAFENVWFNQMGLIVGNSVWSAALVVAAFMAGLALGNGVAVLLARRWGNLVRGYAGLEVLAALSGAAAVLAFPHLPSVFRPLLAPLLDEPAALNVARAAIAFVLMAIPATALGTTLPLLTRPLERASGSFGFALGRLYGMNTLGAVAGVLLAELVLIPALGLRMSGIFAAMCNLTAAGIALRIAPRFESLPQEPQPRRRMEIRILAAAALAGGLLLALEVLWFRFLLLFQSGTTLMFATMLAVVLAGIGAGGLLASRWSRRGWSAERAARLAAAGAACALVAGYGGFHFFWHALLGALEVDSLLLLALLSVFLMGPVCLASGVLFTALGEMLRARSTDAAAATGGLTLANTLGAMAGSLVAAFVLLPGLGVEKAFFLLAALYSGVVLLVPGAGWRLAPAGAALAVLALFPFGRMDNAHTRLVEDYFGARVVAVREGVVETAFYLEHSFLGEPQFYRLATNSHSMSSTWLGAQRYMRLFAYLPAALHPRIERALVICFGVGSTAAAIADLPDLRELDVVDVSRNVLELSDIAHPDPRHHPLRDARAAVRVEDGRFFLQQTGRRYDLITGEPPPPKMAGVAALYTREYFDLLKSRLNPGGLATYWLPVHQMLPGDALAIVRAFCDAFDDCSLWSGLGLEWILMGSRGGLAPVSRESFARLWAHERTRVELRRIAVETPPQLVALFLADAAALKKESATAAPLTDDFPRRLSAARPSGLAEPLFARMMDPARGRARLEQSAWLRALLPGELLAQGAAQVRDRAMLDAQLQPELQRRGYRLWDDVARLARSGDAVALTAWLLGGDARRLEIARRHPGEAAAAEELAVDALANRRRPAAIAKESFLALTPKAQLVTIVHHCVVRDPAAQRLIGWIPAERRAQEPYRSFLAWAAEDCPSSGASPPSSARRGAPGASR